MITLRDERPGGEDTGEDIDAKHHFHRAHFVLENFRLPVRSERIENHVSHQAKKAGKGRCRSITRVLRDSDISQKYSVTYHRDSKEGKWMFQLRVALQ